MSTAVFPGDVEPARDKSPGLVGFREPGVTASGLLAGVSLPG
jgi:hypothetical protein